MPHPPWKLLLLILLLLAVNGDCSLLNAQNTKQAPAPGAAKKSATPAKPVPVEESPLLIEPKTPAGFFKAAVLMHKLARPNLARQYLQKLIDANPDDATLLKMRDAFGPADFLRLNNDKKLRPLSSDLHKRVNALYRKRGADPKFIDRLLQSLMTGSVDDREIAMITLQNTGPIVIPRMLKLAAASKSSLQSANLQEALIRMGTPAVDPLIASLDAPSDKSRIASLAVLARIGGRETVPFLWYSAFSKSQSIGVQTAAKQALSRIYQTPLKTVEQMTPANVAAELKRIAIEHFRRDFKWTVGLDRKVELWSFNTEKQTVERSRVAPTAASLYLGTRFAKQALDLSSENRESQALFLAMALAASADPKWEQPLPTGPGTAHDMALRSGAEVVAAALQISLKNSNASAAIAALVVLRQVAAKGIVIRQSRTQSPLLAALNYPDIRVQMAAATTVLHIDPDSPFRGSHRIVAILARSLNDGGSSRAIVVHANLPKARAIGGFLNDMGFTSQTVQTGRAGFLAAAERGDVDLIVLDTNTIRWSLSQTVANLRADARTAGIPIAVYGPLNLRERILSHLDR
ncbi:MAG: hypothetical protein IID46_03865, partial [Planctomycetes bacterium]|nr:hypothetical protein [Planctomycetota bacterium]